MIEVGIHFEDDVTDRLKAFGNRAVVVFDDSLRALSKEFQGSVRRTELAGAMLGVVTGKYKRKYPKLTKNRYKDHSFYLWGGPLANIYEHPGGADIVAKGKKPLRWLNKDGRWATARRVHLRARPFMSTVSGRFDFAGTFDKTVEVAMQKEIDKQGLK